MLIHRGSSGCHERRASAGPGTAWLRQHLTRGHCGLAIGPSLRQWTVLRGRAFGVLLGAMFAIASMIVAGVCDHAAAAERPRLSLDSAGSPRSVTELPPGTVPGPPAARRSASPASTFCRGHGRLKLQRRAEAAAPRSIAQNLRPPVRQVPARGVLRTMVFMSAIKRSSWVASLWVDAAKTRCAGRPQ